MNKPELNLSCFSYLAYAKVLKISKYPQANSGAEITEVMESVAADGAIMAGAAARLGLKVGFVGNNVGKDKDGQALLAYFKKARITYTLKADPNITTPFIFILSDRDGNREWFSYISQAREGLERANVQVIQKSALAYIDCYAITQTASLRAINTAYESGIPMFVNLGGDLLTSELAASLRGKGIVIIQTNLEEEKQEVVAGLAEEIFAAIKPEVVIITLGSQGAIALTQTSYERAHAYPVNVKHTHGAGAAFSAGIAFGYLQGWPIGTLLQFGCALGSMSCEVENGYDAFSAEDVMRFIGNK